MQGQINIVMGSCYLTKGEGPIYVKEAMQRAARQRVDFYFFDVIARPDQLVDAQHILSDFYAYLDLYLPELPRDHVFTGITCNDMIRPAAMALVVVSKSGSMEFKDVNPDREKRWN